MCDDREASKMEAYLKFYAEYFECKTKQDFKSSGKGQSASALKMFARLKRKNK